MSSRRVLKAAEAIREVVAMSILTDLRDPRIQHATVTYVEVSADMRHAKVHVSVMGEESQQQLTIRGLQNAAGFLQQKIAKRIDTRYTPRLQFLLDKGVKNSVVVSQILRDVLPPEHDDTAADTTATEHDPAGSDPGQMDPSSEQGRTQPADRHEPGNPLAGEPPPDEDRPA